MAVDYRNNAIGRALGAESKDKSRLEIVKAALEKFHKEGFWIAYKTQEGFRLRQVKLGEARHKALKEALEKKDDNARWKTK